MVKFVPATKETGGMMGLVLITGLLFTTFSCAPSSGIPSAQRGFQKDGTNLTLDTAKIEYFPLDCSIRAIYPLGPDECWFAGTRGQYGFTDDGGKTWNLDRLQHNDQPELEFRSIAVTEEAVMLLSIGSPSLLYRSIDRGRSWKIVYRENDSLAFYDSMAFWDDRDGIAMGDPTDSCLSVILTNDGGKNWTKVPCDRLPKTAAGEAAFAASNTNLALYGDHAWMVSGGAKARIFHSPDRGQRWQVYLTPIMAGGKMTGIFSCDFFDADTGIIMGGDWEEMSANRRNKAITFDGGKNWKLLASGQSPGYRSCVQFMSEISAEPIMAVGIPGVSISNDGGITWENLTRQSFYTVRRTENALWFGSSEGMARLQL